MLAAHLGSHCLVLRARFFYRPICCCVLKSRLLYVLGEQTGDPAHHQFSQGGGKRGAVDACPQPPQPRARLPLCDQAGECVQLWFATWQVVLPGQWIYGGVTPALQWNVLHHMT